MKTPYIYTEPVDPKTKQPLETITVADPTEENPKQTKQVAGRHLGRNGDVRSGQTLMLEDDEAAAVVDDPRFRSAANVAAEAAVAGSKTASVDGKGSK